MAYTPAWIESTQGAMGSSERQQRSLYWIMKILNAIPAAVQDRQDK
jgi:hypothetical protein